MYLSDEEVPAAKLTVASPFLFATLKILFDLSAAVIDLMKDPALLKQFGAAGRQRAAAEFGWPAVARATLALYQSLIK